MPRHLILPDPHSVGSRRTRPGPPNEISRNRRTHGLHLQVGLQQVVRSPRRLDVGVDPDLVFKIKSQSRPQENMLEGRALDVLGETADFTYFVLSRDDAATLASALQGYARTGALRSLIDSIDDIEPYGPEDRRGPGLDLPLPEGTFAVDITIWPSAEMAEAQRRAEIVDRALALAGGVSSLRSISSRRSIIRASVTAAGLDILLNVSVVEQVRTPPVPFLDYRDWWELDASQLTRIQVDSAEVGVLDDAPATEHPLLSGLVKSVDLIGPSNYAWQQPGDHGTEVVGRVLLPQLHEQLRDAGPVSTHGTVRVARILEPDPDDPTGAPRFITQGFPHRLVEIGIRQLHEKYGIRVFNLSIGYNEPYSDLHLGPLTEVIDELVRELNIVIVVPTGNAGVNAISGRISSGHHVEADYPTYLDSPEHRLAEPAPAALAITVGSIAHSDGVAELGGRRFSWKAIASLKNLSPFSRTGPGVGANSKRQNKPDVVHYGGNFAMNDTGQVVSNEPGVSVVSTALNSSTGKMFKACNGTSFAAPVVARIAADIQHAYPDASANLIRALLAVGARIPDPAVNTTNLVRRAARFGLGLPDAIRSIESGMRRSTMTYDGSMPVDTVRIHPVPIPEVFRRGSGGSRSISVALAFDPPVKRQRREYLAAVMQVDLYRNVTIDELEEVLQRQEPGGRLPLIKDRRNPQLLPGSDSVSSSTLQVRSWTVRNQFVNDPDVFYVAVTHRSATWARGGSDYEEQPYALTVTLEDENLVNADLHQLLTQQVSVPARLRLRS